MPFQGEHGETETVTVALGKFSLAIGFEQQRQMGKLRHRVFPSEGTIEQNVKGSTGQPLFTTDDVGDFHQVVVHDVGQMISGQFVGTLVKHFVVEDFTLHNDFATDKVVNMDFLAGFNLEANHILLPFGNHGIDLLLRQRQGIAHHATRGGVILEILDFSTFGLQFLWGVESDVSLTGSQELLHIFLIDIAALTLAIRAILTTEADTLVELDAEPTERLDDIILRSGHETAGVGILNTEHEVASVLTGKQIIIQRSTHSSNVQSTRGTGCKTHSNSSF